MAKYPCPVTFEEFVAVVTGQGDAVEVFRKLGDEEEPLRRAYSCMKTGFMNKMYHADAQEKNNAELRIVREALRKDPSLKARLLSHEKAKGV